MIVILILAVLVGIAIPTYLIIRGRAQETTAESNYKIGCSTMNRVWFDLAEQGSDNYLTSPTNFARYLSQRETKIKWVLLRRGGATTLQHQQTWKNNSRLENTTTGDLGYVYGDICVYRGRLDPSNRRWYNSGATDNYQSVTVVVCSQKDNKASFTSYRNGIIYSSGTFDWGQGTGSTTNFVLD